MKGKKEKRERENERGKGVRKTRFNLTKLASSPEHDDSSQIT